MPQPQSARDQIVRTSERATLDEMALSHPLNPSSKLFMTRLSDPTGLTHLGVSLARLLPGKESFAMHAHSLQEEWIYVVSGSGEVRIGDASLRLAPGDFVGFPAGGHAHIVRNDSDAELVYLQGGDRRKGDVARFPELGLIGYQHDDGHMALVAESQVQLRPFSDWLAKD